MFKELGYFKEFYIEGKLIGFANCEKDREEIGYVGRRKEILSSEVLLTNKKKAKAFVEYMTILYPLCGRIEN